MLQTEWSQPQILGDLVTHRAGHAGVTIDETWYIVGGGDNRKGMYNDLLPVYEKDASFPFSFRHY